MKNFIVIDAISYDWLSVLHMHNNMNRFAWLHDGKTQLNSIIFAAEICN